jgi:hypothetical protein
VTPKRRAVKPGVLEHRPTGVEEHGTFVRSLRNLGGLDASGASRNCPSAKTRDAPMSRCSPSTASPACSNAGCSALIRAPYAPRRSAVVTRVERRRGAVGSGSSCCRPLSRLRRCLIPSRGPWVPAPAPVSVAPRPLRGVRQEAPRRACATPARLLSFTAPWPLPCRDTTARGVLS